MQKRLDQTDRIVTARKQDAVNREKVTQVSEIEQAESRESGS